MKNQNAGQERLLFHAAKAIQNADQQQLFLEAIGQVDQGLRNRVSALLAAAPEAERFFETGVSGWKANANELFDAIQREGSAEAGEVGPGAPVAPLVLARPPVSGNRQSRPGEIIGRYKPLQELGEGGCGIVYVAEQVGPVRQRVALKLIKPGMDSKAVLARFEGEREALALMDHPSIARILDGGTTAEGRPYFVMELVPGLRITEHCDQNRLNTTERLGLFVQVCQAVQHAHQKGVIHRDLKPSNVLVTVQHGVAVPKIIDFGIAKAVKGRLTEGTVFTQLHQFVGTPAYMSPEQADMQGLDVDTRTDIYSLGVLLYELLTGATPLDTRELCRIGVEELRHSICEVEPPRPSARLATLSGDKLKSTALCRSVPPPRLADLVKGDLDWIVMKCLEKDRDRRYETASALAADLERHLAHEPVLARPPGVAYRLQKAIRRHRVWAVAGLVALVGLVGGLATTLWMYGREATAHRAVQEAERRQDLARKAADAQRAAAEHLLGRELVDDGWTRWSRGDFWAALGCFTEALRLDHDDPQHERIHRLRIASAAASAPRLLRTWNIGRPITAAAFTPDSQGVAIAAEASDRGFEARLWDYRTGKVISGSMSHSGPIRVLALSPDGRRAFTASDDGTARVWDARTGQPVTPPLLLGQPPQYGGISPDGTWAVAGGTSGKNHPEGILAVWNLESGAELRREKIAGWSIRSLSISPDSAKIAVGSFTYRAMVLEVTGERGLIDLPDCWRMYASAFSPDSQRLLMAGAFGGDAARRGGRVLNMPDLTFTTPLLQHQQEGFAAAFSPDGARVATAGLEHGAQLWDAVSGQAVLARLPHTSTLSKLQFSADGHLLWGISSDHLVSVWSSATGTGANLPLPQPAEVCAAAFDPQGFAVGLVTADGAVSAWNYPPSKVPDFEFDQGQAVQAAMFGASNILYAADAHGLSSYQLEGEKRIDRLTASLGAYVLALEPVTGGLLSWNDECVCFLAPATASSRFECRPTGEWLGLSQVAFPGSPEALLFSRGSSEAKRYNISSGETTVLYQAGFPLYAAALTPDGARLFGFGPDRQFVLWEPRSGQVLDRGVLAGAAAEPEKVFARFSPNGQHLVILRGDQPAELYATATSPPDPLR